MYSLHVTLDGDNATDILKCLNILEHHIGTQQFFLMTYLYQTIRGLLTPRLDVNACMRTTRTNTS